MNVPLGGKLGGGETGSGEEFGARSGVWSGFLLSI